MVNITVKPETYFITKNEEGQRPLISELEISGLYKPEYLGRVIAEQMDEGSLIAQLMLQGRETTVSTDQVMWKEEDGKYSVNKVIGKNLVTRTGDSFAINSNAIPDDPFDIDSNRPSDAQWIVEVGMEFVAIDSSGVMNIGKITAISTDSKSFTAKIFGEGASAWTIATADLDIIFTGYNLDHCECPPCIGYKKYAPTRENSMFKDGECVEYCEETLANEGAGTYDLLEVGKGEFVEVDERLTRAQKSLVERMEYSLAFGKRMTEAQASSFGQKSRGMNGIFPILDDRALKYEGMIETIDDFTKIANSLKKEGIKSATIRATDDQMSKINALVTPTSPYYITPFQDNTNSLFYIGFGGIKVNGVTLIFKEWSALNSLSENLAQKYHYVIVPEGVLTKVINGQKVKVGYLELIWFKAFNKVYKFLRDKEGEEKKCGNTKIDYISKFTIALFHPEKWILGVAV
ncbi:MAG: hypothetical protein WCJ72_11630 [Chryseobacterium sp.]